MTQLRIAYLIISLIATSVQNCYYPNGDLSTDDVPCSSNGGICCPLSWECMSNGLCYLESEQYYERHSCTDKTWPSSLCPQICTHGMQAGGNEAMLWCPSGDWCCDGNRSWNCCTQAGTDYFPLSDPHSVAFISATSATSVSPNSRAISTTSDHSTSSPTNSSPTSDLNSKAASTTTSSTTGSPSTATKTSTQAGLGGQQPSSNSVPKPNLGVILGLALGIPLFVLACGIPLFFIFRCWRRSRDKSNLPKADPPPVLANYQNAASIGHADELAGYPVAKSARYSELSGSEAYVRSPTFSVGTAGSTPPLYSPGGRVDIVRINEEEPHELWGGYVPYRAPNAQVMEVDEGSEGKQKDHGS